MAVQGVACAPVMYNRLLAMLIPLDSLKPETLRRVIAEYVTRDGTDLADVDLKVEQVLRQLRAGRAELHYDEEGESTTIVDKARP